MRLFFDLGLGKLISKPGYTSLLSKVGFKRGDGGTIEVAFSRDGGTEAITGDVTEMVFVVKASRAAIAPALIIANDWSYNEDTRVWSSLLTADADSLQDLLGTDGVRNLHGEFTFTTTTTVGPVSSQTLVVTVENDVWKGTEGTPLEEPNPVAWINIHRPAPLALTAPPVNGALQLELVQFIASSGITADGTCNVVVTGDGITGSPLTIPVALTTITHTTDVLIATAIINALLANAAFAVLWDIITPPSTAAFTIFRKSNAANDATLNVVIPPGLGISSGSSSNLRAGVLGTVATAKGQLAIVTTTNASGTFQDVWTCSNLFPYTWQPPGRITRAPNGTLYRAIVDNTGIPSTEPAYP